MQGSSQGLARIIWSNLRFLRKCLVSFHDGPENKKTNYLRISLCSCLFYVLQGGPLLAIYIYIYKWSYNPYKWPKKWATGVTTLLIWVITTPYIIGDGAHLVVFFVWGPERFEILRQKQCLLHLIGHLSNKNKLKVGDLQVFCFGTRRFSDTFSISLCCGDESLKWVEISKPNFTNTQLGWPNLGALPIH